MKLLRTFFGLLLGLLLAWPAAAQCLNQAELVAFTQSQHGGAAAARLQLEVGWRFMGFEPSTRNPTWSFVADSLEPATALLTLRPNTQVPGFSDLVLQTNDPACARQLRNALARRRRTAQPVACPGCEGQRYEDENYTFSFYYYPPKKEGYSCAIVVHFIAVPAVAEQKVVRTE